ncbi:MAG: Gmad2 immunoglobulin-like domain-containing protein [bacterium]
MDKKYWFFGSKLNTALLLVLIILMVIALRFMYQNKQVYFPNSDDMQMGDASPKGDSADAVPAVIGPNKDDLVSFSIAPGGAVHGMTHVTGVVKNNYFFEGNIVIHALDADKKHVFETHGTATTDWMTAGPVTFGADIDFSKAPKGPGYIEIHNDNPSGDEKKRKDHRHSRRDTMTLWPRYIPSNRKMSRKHGS